MKAENHIDENEAKIIAEKLNVDFFTFDISEFKEALNVELDAEIKEGEIRPEDDLTDKELAGIGRVTLAHMHSFKD